MIPKFFIQRILPNKFRRSKRNGWKMMKVGFIVDQFNLVNSCLLVDCCDCPSLGTDFGSCFRQRLWRSSNCQALEELPSTFMARSRLTKETIFSFRTYWVLLKLNLRNIIFKTNYWIQENIFIATQLCPTNKGSLETRFHFTLSIVY